MNPITTIVTYVSAAAGILHFLGIWTLPQITDIVNILPI